MKQTILISESKLVEMIKLIVENEIDLSEFEDSDFIDVFIIVFKKWIHSKIGDEINNYPISFLLKKYSSDFFKTFDQSYERKNWEGDISTRDFIRYGREIVKRKLYKLPTLKKGVKFTEKFAKQLDYLLSRLKVPSFYTIKLVEQSPYKIEPTVDINFEEMIKYDRKVEEINSPSVVINKLKRSLIDYMGVKFGSPAHGQLQFNYPTVNMSSSDLWVESVFNKQIKKQIKENCNKEGYIHSLKFKVKDFSAEIVITYKSKTPSFSSKTQTRNCIEEYVQNVLGYKNISVSNY